MNNVVPEGRLVPFPNSRPPMPKHFWAALHGPEPWGYMDAAVKLGSSNKIL